MPDEAPPPARPQRAISASTCASSSGSWFRIFEEVISPFDSLNEAQMNVVGVTPKWSAKDLLADLAYWERAAADEIREFEAGRRPAKKRTRSQMERINREVVSRSLLEF
jgi:hypothetical protein